MKTCLRCNSTLPLVMFHSRTHISEYTGEPTSYHNSYCKDCNKLNCRDSRNTKEGLFRLIYSGQLTSSKSRGHAPPNYTKNELITWIESQPNFNQLFSAWVNSGYNRWLKPSPDRLNEGLPYTLDNLRLTTWGDNAAAFKQKKVQHGIGDCRAVHQFLNNTLIQTFHSLHEAERQTGAASGNILRCCRGEYKTSKGFVWRYADE